MYIEPFNSMPPRNFDQTWRSIYPFSKMATRKKCREVTKNPFAGFHKDIRSMKRLRRKTQVGVKTGVMCSERLKKEHVKFTSRKGQREDFRFDPLYQAPLLRAGHTQRDGMWVLVGSGSLVFCIYTVYVYIHITYIYIYIYIPGEICVPGEARKAFTFCGSVWSDGSPGPVAISIAHGGIAGALLKELNEVHKGQALFIMSSSDTHMMCSNTLIQMYEELFVGGFKMQRQKYNLDHSVKGMLLCDAFTGAHSAEGRRAFETRNSVHMEKIYISRSLMC